MTSLANTLQTVVNFAGAAAGVATAVGAVAYGGQMVKDNIHQILPNGTIRKHTTDLTEEAEQGKLSRAYCREREVQWLKGKIQQHGLVILEGKPGVGKSALVEELACRIAKNAEPSLQNYRILQFKFERSLGNGMRAAFNQIWQGGLESTIQGLFTEIIAHNEIVSEKPENGGKIALYIDEIQDFLNHAPAIFDPYKGELARKQLVIIGATTESAQVDDWLAVGPARNSTAGFRRRTERLNVEEPSQDRTIEILEKIKQAIQDKTQRQGISLTIESKALEAAVYLASQYRRDGKELCYPDKAIVFLQDALGRAIDKARNKQTNDLTFTEYDVCAFLADTLEKDAGLIQENLAQIRRGVAHWRQFPENYFPEISFGNAKEQPALLLAIAESLKSFFNLRFMREGVTAVHSFFKQMTEQKKGLLLVGTSKAYLKRALAIFAKESGRGGIMSCSIPTLIRLWKENPQKTMQAIQQAIDSKRGKFSEELVLHLEDGNPAEGESLLAALSVKPSVSQSAAASSSSLQVLDHPDAPLLLQQASQAMAQVGGIVQRAIGHQGRNSDSASSTSSQVDSNPVIDFFCKLLKENHIAHVITTSPEVAKNHSNHKMGTSKVRDLSLQEAVQYLAALQEGQGISHDLLAKLLCTLQLLQNGENIPLDEAIEVLQKIMVKSNQATDEEILKTEISLHFGALEAVEQAWEKASLREAEFFIEKENPLMEALEKGLPEILRQHLFALQGTPRLLQIEEESKELRNLLREQIADFALQQKMQVAMLDLSPLKTLSPAMQRLYVEERLTGWKEKIIQSEFSSLLFVKEEDFELPWVQESLAHFVNLCSVVCLGAPKASSLMASAASQQDSIGTLIDRGVGMLQNIGLAPSSLPAPAAATSTISAAPPILQTAFPSRLVYQRKKELSESQMHSLILYTLKWHSAVEGLEKTPFTEEINQALSKIYTLLHQQGLSPDEIAEAVRVDFDSFKAQKSGQISLERLISHLHVKFGEKYGLSENEFKYAVNPALTTSLYRLVRQVQRIVKAVGSVLMTPLTWVFQGLGGASSFVVLLGGTVLKATFGRLFGGR